MDQLVTVLVTVVIVIVVILLALWMAAGMDNRRLSFGFRALFGCLRDPATAEKVHQALVPVQVETPAAVKPSGVPLRLLALLQREGRLLDFLLEDIQGYSDEQVGAAVRDIHRQCQAALKEHLVLTPVMPEAEGATVVVPAGFDPSAIRLTGNVTGQPPYRGALQHHGWRVKEIKLATPPVGQDEMVVMPAEVELP